MWLQQGIVQAGLRAGLGWVTGLLRDLQWSVRLLWGMSLAGFLWEQDLLWTGSRKGLEPGHRATLGSAVGSIPRRRASHRQKKKKLNPCIISYNIQKSTRNELKTKTLRLKIIQLLEEYIGTKALWYWSRQWLLGYDIKSTDDKSKNKWNYVKLKGINNMKKHPTEWEKIFANIYLTRNLYLAYINSFLIIKKPS